MGFDRSVSPSPSIRRSSIQSSDGDENKENDHQVFVNMPKTPKKPNYMSPTISASSKVITPKKKILASEPILDNAHKSLCAQEPRSPRMPVTQFTLGKEDMDGRSVSSSSSSSLSIRLSSLQFGVGENKENDHQTPKKPMISGSSKAITPKKKVLAERNEASEPVLNDAHESLCPQEPRSPQTAVTRFVPGKEELDSSKPYDPLTNFLSPRPQFLRYNPNRRRETVVDGETEDGLIRRSSSSSSSSSISLINGEIGNLTEEEVKEEVTEEEVTEVEVKEEEVTEEEVTEVEVKEEEVTEEEEEEEEDEEEEEEVEEIKVTNEEIEESDSSEIEDGVKVGNSGSEVGTKTLLFLLILGLCQLFVIYVNSSMSSCGLRLQNGGIESDYYGTRNHSLEAVLVKNNLQSGDGFWHQRVFERGNMVKEEGDFDDIIKWSEELKISESSVEATQEVDPTISQIEEASFKSYAPTLSEDHYETEVNPIEESIDTAETAMDEIKISNDSVEAPEEVEPVITEIEEENLETNESIGSYSPTLSEDQCEAEVNLIEEAIETAETTIDEIVSESPVMDKARTLLVNLMRTEAEFALKVFIGAVTLLTIVACYFLGSNSSPKTTNKKNIAAAKEPQKPRMEEDHTYEDYSFENSLSSSIHSTEKGNEEYSKTKAPSVGFLSEFVVGEINSSPSYGSYSAQVKAPKKLAGGEVSTVITPVRRSSRIRNLSIKSP